MCAILGLGALLIIIVLAIHIDRLKNQMRLVENRLTEAEHAQTDMIIRFSNRMSA